MIFPLPQWLSSYNKEKARQDILAGLTTAVMLIPQAMAYALLADLPTYVGLYAAAIPPIIYGFLGTSRALALGPVAIDSLLTASIVGAIATSGTEDYLVFCSLLAICAGSIQFLLGLLRLGFLVKYLTRPVISGFLTAAGMIIAANQIKLLLGISLPQTSFLPHIVQKTFEQIDQSNGETMLISFLSIVMLVILKRYAPKSPRALLSLALGTLLSLGLGLQIDTIGNVPSGLPSFSFPAFSWDVISSIGLGSFTIAMIGFMEAYSVAKHLQKTEDLRLRADQELIAVGLGNIFAGCFRGYPVSAGLSRSAVSNSAGAQTPICSIVNGIFVCATLLLLSPLLAPIPKATLGAIIFVAIVGFIDRNEPLQLWKVDRVDFIVYLLTFFCTILTGIQSGVLVGILVSLVLSMRFRNKELQITDKANTSDKLVLSVVGDICFENVHLIQNHMKNIDMKEVEHIVICDWSYLDSTAKKALERDCKKRNISIFFDISDQIET